MLGFVGWDELPGWVGYLILIILTTYRLVLMLWTSVSVFNCPSYIL